MSGGPVCSCPLRHKVVVTRCGNYSAFNGYRFTPSDYSCIRCLRCGIFFRTKARYVEQLRNATKDEAIRP